MLGDAVTHQAVLRGAVCDETGVSCLQGRSQSHKSETVPEGRARRHFSVHSYFFCLVLDLFPAVLLTGCPSLYVNTPSPPHVSAACGLQGEDGLPIRDGKEPKGQAKADVSSFSYVLSLS